MKLNLNKILLISILLLAGVLRLYKISLIPPSLSWDEAAIGYDAYSIAETGRDQWGVPFPLAFKSFGEYKYPFHIYTTTLMVKLFGLNEFSVRIGSAILGIINILLMYFLVKLLFKNRNLALVSALLFTISPWHIQFSRVSWETNYLLLFFLGGFILLYKGLIQRENLKIITAFLLFGISLFTYNAAKIFIPLFLIGFEFFYFKEVWKLKKMFILPTFIFVLLFSLNLFNPSLSGLNRYGQLGFEESRVSSTFAYQKTHIYKLGWLQVALEQYLSHFSLKYLFVSGDPNPRHSIQTVGELLIYDLLLLPLGLLVLLKKIVKKEKKYLLLGYLFLLWPIPASIAREYPHASRAMFGMVILPIVSALGFTWILGKMKGKRRVMFDILSGLLGLLMLVNYLSKYYVSYPIKYSQYWQYGYKEVTKFVKANYNNYDKVYITRAYGEPQIFLLFYLKYPPEKYQFGDDVIREKVGDWVRVGAFDKYIFLDKEVLKREYSKLSNDRESKRLLFIGIPGDFPKNRILKTINFLDGLTAFEMTELI